MGRNVTTLDESRPSMISELQLVRDQLNQRIDHVDQRISDLRIVMLWGFGLLVALFLALLGVILSGAG